MACTETDAFILVRGVHKTLGRQDVLRGVDLEVKRGEVLCLVGRSGEGKSVLSRHMIGLMQPDRGQVFIEGCDISRLPERKLAEARRKIGVLFQNGALFDSMTLAQNVAFPLLELGEKRTDVIHRKVMEVLEAVGLAEHHDKLPMSLSGGQRKRGALARAVVARPAAILYDEPTSGLDPIGSDTIARLIHRIRDQFGVTSIVITHDMKVVETIGDRVAYLYGGQIYFLGTPLEWRTSADPAISDFVVGRSREFESTQPACAA